MSKFNNFIFYITNPKELLLTDLMDMELRRLGFVGNGECKSNDYYRTEIIDEDEGVGVSCGRS